PTRWRWPIRAPRAPRRAPRPLEEGGEGARGLWWVVGVRLAQRNALAYALQEEDLGTYRHVREELAGDGELAHTTNPEPKERRVATSCIIPHPTSSHKA